MLLWINTKESSQYVFKILHFAWEKKKKVVKVLHYLKVRGSQTCKNVYNYKVIPTKPLRLEAVVQYMSNIIYNFWISLSFIIICTENNQSYFNPLITFNNSLRKWIHFHYRCRTLYLLTSITRFVKRKSIAFDFCIFVRSPQWSSQINTIYSVFLTLTSTCEPVFTVSVWSRLSYSSHL